MPPGLHLCILCFGAVHSQHQHRATPPTPPQPPPQPPPGPGGSQAEPAQHKAPLTLRSLSIFLSNLDFLLFFCSSDTEAQCEVMQEIVDQVLEVTGSVSALCRAELSGLQLQGTAVLHGGGGSAAAQPCSSHCSSGPFPAVLPCPRAGCEHPSLLTPSFLPPQEDFDSEQLSVLASCLQELFKAHFRGEVLPEEITEE